MKLQQFLHLINVYCSYKYRISISSECESLTKVSTQLWTWGVYVKVAQSTKNDALFLDFPIILPCPSPAYQFSFLSINP